MTDLGSFNKHILLKEKNIIPLMQGGMGVGVSFSGLAGAVASCNAIGIISTAQAGFAEPDFETNTLQSCLRAIDRQIKRAKEIAPTLDKDRKNEVIVIGIYSNVLKIKINWL